MPGLVALSVLAAAAMGAAPPDDRDSLPSLQGTWRLENAYERRADGTLTHNYGLHPQGLMMVDAAGRYTIQIFREDRAPFRSNDKAAADAAEYRDAALGSSTHFGSVRIDAGRHQLLFSIEAASFPNWNGKTQVRDFTYRDGLLSYAVPASASGNGTVAYSVWRRIG